MKKLASLLTINGLVPTSVNNGIGFFMFDSILRVLLLEYFSQIKNRAFRRGSARLVNFSFTLQWF